MTRKCALCKETNYKNAYSFFSAPKDPVMRKCWQDVTSLEVTDDTYICSKHFHQEDIITHWVSGQPPHVITIKYKKCRLRPGAIPIVGVEFQNNINNADEEDDEYELRVNRRESSNSETMNDTNMDNRIHTRYELSYSQGKKKCRVKEKEKDIENDGNYNIYVACDDNIIEEMEITDTNIKQEQVETFLIPREDINTLIQEESGDYDEAVRDYIIRTEQKKRNFIQNEIVQDEQEGGSTKKKLKTNKPAIKIAHVTSENIEAGPIYLTNETLSTINEDQTIEVWETSVDETPTETVNEEDSHSENMLFEDVLEAYTEVALPNGWSSTVIPKGVETTIVYSYTSTTNSRIPFVEKQIYLKNDMVLHFCTSSTEIDGDAHNLLRDGRNSRIQSLADIEDVIEEFDQRYVCQGVNVDKIDLNLNNLSSVAVREGTKWRHLECPILISNDTLTCSKCTYSTITKTLDIYNNHRSESQNISEMENNTNADNINENPVAEFELNPSPNTINLMAKINTLNIPEIQKIMMKECLKNSTELDGQKSIKFSKTWIFLCVLLYIESPRMYRYLLLNNYLSLPPLFTIKRYLHRIKTEPRFYSYFQRSIEPFQPSENDAELKQAKDINHETGTQ